MPIVTPNVHDEMIEQVSCVCLHPIVCSPRSGSQKGDLCENILFVEVANKVLMSFSVPTGTGQSTVAPLTYDVTTPNKSPSPYSFNRRTGIAHDPTASDVLSLCNLGRCLARQQ